MQREEIERLIELNRLPNVVPGRPPLRYGGYTAAGGPFTILTFREPDLPDIVHLEQLTSALYLDKRVDVEHYTIRGPHVRPDRSHRTTPKQFFKESATSSESPTHS